MAATATVLARTTLTTTSATLYTTPASTTAVITNILLVNTTASAATATLSLNGVVLVPGVSIAANSVFAMDIRQVLATTQTITAQAGTASAITCHIGGVQLT